MILSPANIKTTAPGLVKGRRRQLWPIPLSFLCAFARPTDALTVSHLINLDHRSLAPYARYHLSPFAPSLSLWDREPVSDPGPPCVDCPSLLQCPWPWQVQLS